MSFTKDLDFRKFLYETADELGADAENKDDAANKDEGSAKDTDKDSKKDEGKEHMIPKSRFDEINGKYKELQNKLDELIGNKEKEDKATKEKAGEFEELYKTANSDNEKLKGESKTSKARVEALEGVINGLLENELKAVPKEFHDLIPENLTPEAKLAWINTAKGKGLFGSKKNEPLGEQTNPGGKQQSDISKLSVGQLLRAGYGQK